MAVYLKSPTELMLMREAGRIVARALEEIRYAIKPGVSTWELDQIAVRVFQLHGAKPAFLGYPPGSEHPFPATINACLNYEVVHGIPSKDRIIKEGDLVGIDTACHYKGYVGDAAFTVAVGEVPPEVRRLVEVTEQALYVGIAASQEGRQTMEVCKAIQNFVESKGYGVVQNYTGHGVGRKMHEEPSMPNWWPPPKQARKDRRWKNYTLKRGMTYALEPMVTMGDPATEELSDHWTVVTKDRSLSAHFEHTIAIVDTEPLILTLP